MENKDNRVKKVCGELGITQKELAEILGVNVSSVTNWATGKVDIPSVVLKCFDLLLVEKKFNQLKELIKDNLD
jgi:transcriptional regulator with XRE-family HTH domain